MKIEEMNVPDGPCIVWARTSGMAWWNLIVRVSGDAPFMRMDAFDLRDDTAHRDIKLHEIQEFGAVISKEIPDVAGKRRDIT